MFVFPWKSVGYAHNEKEGCRVLKFILEPYRHLSIEVTQPISNSLSLRETLYSIRSFSLGSTYSIEEKASPYHFPSFPNAKVLETAFIPLFPKSNPVSEKIIKHRTQKNLLQNYIIRLANLGPFLHTLKQSVLSHSLLLITPQYLPDRKWVVFWFPSLSPFKISQHQTIRRKISQVGHIFQSMHKRFII